MSKFILIYKLGNFSNGKVAETESKKVYNDYLKLGYKLITVAFLTSFEYIDWKIGNLNKNENLKRTAGENLYSF